MDWAGILIGAAIGIALDRLIGTPVEAWCRVRIQRRRYRWVNNEWANSELSGGSLQVIQTGWGSDGCFAPGSVKIELDTTAPSVRVPVLDQAVH